MKPINETRETLLGFIAYAIVSCLLIVLFII